MANLKDRIDYFKGLQQVIMAEAQAIQVKTAEFQNSDFVVNAQRELNELNQALENKKEQYKAEMKAEFGVCDGEQINILDVVQMTHKVASYIE